MENLRNMPFEALVGVVESHPWFGAAQKVLCERTGLMGGRDLARDMYAAAALQVASRKKVLAILRPNAFPGVNILRDYAFSGVPADRTNGGVSEKDIPQNGGCVPAEEIAVNAGPTMLDGVNKNYRGAGDYFSREQYEQVKKGAREAAEKATGHASDINSFNLDRDVSLDGFCTEALAEIYAEQGYFERAKDIYAKLILAEPEKNTYFASLIEKMNEKN